MIRPQFVAEGIYHVYNRSVERRNIFVDDKDRFRFVHDLFEFNDSAPATNMNYRSRDASNGNAALFMKKPREKLVDILCFCMMRDHYHLLLQQRVDSGITEFMRKIGTGYTNYFNQKHQRIGPLFQGNFKAVHVVQEAHLQYLPHYIHCNPLDFFMPEWRNRRIHDARKVQKFLETYRWSSYPDYAGKRNFPSILSFDVYA